MFVVEDAYLDLSFRLDNMATADESLKTAFVHAPLKANSQQIRLITVEPGVASQPIRCRMCVEELDESSSGHIALSYVWGTDDASRVIEINEHNIAVRENLHHFLRYLQSLAVGNVLHGCKVWVDALCINQLDIPERDEQVRRMNRIYSSASTVVSWLGYGVPAIEQAFHGIETNRVRWRQRNVQIQKTVNEGMSLLSDLEYWKRLWIVPEVYSAENLTMVFGKALIDWTSLSYFGNTFYSTYLSSLGGPWTPRKPRPNDNDFAIMCQATQYFKTDSAGRTGMNTFEKLLWDHKNKGCADARDRVYALMAIASDNDPSLIDYRQTKEDLCARMLGDIKFPQRLAMDFGNMLITALGCETAGLETSEEPIDLDCRSDPALHCVHTADLSNRAFVLNEGVSCKTDSRGSVSTVPSSGSVVSATQSISFPFRPRRVMPLQEWLDLQLSHSTIANHNLLNAMTDGSLSPVVCSTAFIHAARNDHSFAFAATKANRLSCHEVQGILLWSSNPEMQPINKLHFVPAPDGLTLHKFQENDRQSGTTSNLPWSIAATVPEQLISGSKHKRVCKEKYVLQVPSISAAKILFELFARYARPETEMRDFEYFGKDSDTDQAVGKPVA